MNFTQTPNTPIINKKTEDFRVKYKTEICRYWIEKGFCPFRESCTFAHSTYQIRTKPHLPSNYKTKPCINFTLRGFCTYGTRCQYLHVDSQDFQEQGQKTRSNSQESNSSQSSEPRRCNNIWGRMTHNKRIELIQNLGLDYSIRTSSRLMQMLNSNQHEDSWKCELMFDEKIVDTIPTKGKKYSL